MRTARLREIFVSTEVIPEVRVGGFNAEEYFLFPPPSERDSCASCCRIGFVILFGDIVHRMVWATVRFDLWVPRTSSNGTYPQPYWVNRN